MRLYILKNGKPTSITISDLLCDLMAAKLALRYTDRLRAYKKGRKTVQGWINELAAGEPVPASNVSQWVQARIVAAITDPEIIEARELLRSGIDQERRRLAALRAAHDSQAENKIDDQPHIRDADGRVLTSPDEIQAELARLFGGC